jgi:hypothetical protein
MWSAPEGFPASLFIVQGGLCHSLRPLSYPLGSFILYIKTFILSIRILIISSIQVIPLLYLCLWNPPSVRPPSHHENRINGLLDYLQHIVHMLMQNNILHCRQHYCTMKFEMKGNKQGLRVCSGRVGLRKINKGIKSPSIQI